MPKLSEEYSRIINRIYATREEVIHSLMQRAEEGRSRYTVDEMKAEIERRIKSTELTAHEKAVLEDIKRGAADQPRSIQMLNALARNDEHQTLLKGGELLYRTRFEMQTKEPTHPAPAIFQ